jgi:DNA/RNA-binding domain of Phe-tRNA-synthetase-like protein
MSTRSPESVLAEARVEPEVITAHPTYRALLLVARGLVGGPSDEASETALVEAERATRELSGTTVLDDLAQVSEWRAAYRSFGVKPRQARSSVESLLRRAEVGLPRIDRLTDMYNAVSVLRLLPLGGEDLDHYVGPPRLVVARGDEPFDTVADGESVRHVADAGEVVWRDDLGVTCRRWNWRQCTRTRLTTATTNALFILDGLGSTGTDELRAAAADLERRLAGSSPEATFETRLLP